MYIVKKKLNVQKRTFLTKNISSIIHQNIAPKYKDLDCSIISCVIENFKIKCALFDLSASANLLPYSMYKQLDLGEFKPSLITFQLANHYVKMSRVIEDVMVQINKFYF